MTWMRGVVALARGADGGDDLRGVVAVVVDDGDAPNAALDLKAPVDATKRRQPGGDLLRRELQLDGDGDRGGGVEDVVAAGDMEVKGANDGAVGGNLKAGANAIRLK